MNVTLPNGKVISGVPEGTTKEQVMQKAIASGLIEAQEFEGLKDSKGFQEYAPEPEKKERSFMDRMFGEEGQRSVFNAPELNELSWRAAKAGLGGLLTGDPKELQSIIKKQYPEAVLGDIDGQPAVKLPSGEYLLNPEGLDLGDVGRFGVDVAAFTPAAKVIGTGAKQLVKGAATAGAISAGMQGAEAALGGEFDVEDVATDAGVQAGFQKAAPAIEFAIDKAKPFVKKIADKLRSSKETPHEDIAKALATGKAKNLVPEVMKDPEVMKAADELGLNVNPGVYSTSDVYREMENALKAIPGSKLSAQEKETVRQLGDKADEIIKEFGGATDKSQLSYDFKESAMKTIEDMAKEASGMYERFAEVIPKSVKVKPRNTIALIDDEISSLGGLDNLDAKLKEVYKKLSNKPTYALLEKTRKDVGDALRGTGPFKDSSQYDLKRLYSSLSDDANGVATFFDLGEEVAAAKKLVSTRKSIESDMQAALGKDLSKDLMAEISGGIKGVATGKGASRLDKTLKIVPPDQRQEVIVTALNDIFTGGTAKAKDFSLGAFVSTYEALKRNAKASSAIFKELPKPAIKRLDGMYKVSKGLMELNRKDLANPSGTARQVVGAMNAPDGILSKLYNVGRQAGAGAAATAPFDAGMIGATAGVVNALKSGGSKATEAADELLASAGFKDALKNYAQGNTEKSKFILEKLSSFKKWLAAQPPEVKRSIERQGAIAYLTGGDSDN